MRAWEPELWGGARPRGGSAATYAVLLLSSSVEDIQKASLVVDGNLLAVAILDRGVVLVDEVVLDQLDSEGGLSVGAEAKRISRSAKIL